MATPRRQGPGDAARVCCAGVGVNESQAKIAPDCGGPPLASKSVQGPVLGLDLGERRIGLAVSDPAAAIAFPIGALDRQSPAADIRSLCDLIRERGVVAVVVGLPLHLSGRAGAGAEAARRFAKALGDACALPVELVDERLTTVLAERALREHPRGRNRSKRRKGQVDALAAALILRTWLEQPRAGRS